MKNLNIFYHITSKNNLNTILENGLECRFGNHRKQIGERKGEPLIYLTKRRNIPVWLRCFIDGTIVLKVDTTGYKIKRKRISTWCGNIWEYGCFNNIPPDRLKIVYN